MALLAAIAPAPSPSRVSVPIRALIAGARTVLRMPVMVLAVYAATLLVITPVAALLYRALGPLIASTPLGDPDAQRFPVEAWDEAAQHASGIAATFAPRILGLAAPVDTISGILDAKLPSAAVLPIVGVYAGVWVLLWGGVLDACCRGAWSMRSFAAAAWRTAFPLGRVTLVALGIYVLLFFTLHRALFVLLERLTTGTSEPVAFCLRLVLYGLFGSLLVLCTLVADYARIEVVVRARTHLGEAVRHAWGFICAHPVAVGLLAAASGGFFAGLLGAYGYFELYTRGAPAAWQAIAIGQAYIVGRLVLRLITAASQVELYNRLKRGP